VRFSTSLIMLCMCLAGATIGVRQRSGLVEVTADGKLLTKLYYGENWDKPFLHPLQTPSGVIVSRGWPVSPVSGESSDHIWHRGVFFGHGDVNGVDIWRELGREKTGRLITRGKPAWKREALSVDTDMVAPGGKKLGSMLVSFAFAQESRANIIDAQLTIRADSGVELKLGDTEEALFGIRLSEEFRQDRGATLMNSDGLTTTEKIWGNRALWVDYSTIKDGREVGVAILDHPSNPRHPTYWHARGYGLNSANIFGVKHFTGDKTQDGSLSIAAGRELTFRHSVILHDGDAAASGVKQMYEAFTRR
jgi:hypothetical protein